MGVGAIGGLSILKGVVLALIGFLVLFPACREAEETIGEAVASPEQSSSPIPVLVETVTSGDVCHLYTGCPTRRLETFSGGYVFKGQTVPSDSRQRVNFSYRLGDSRWHPLGRLASKSAALVSIEDTAHAFIDSRHRWRIRFDIGPGAFDFENCRGRECYEQRIKLRAVYPAQGDFASSQIVISLTAHYGD